MGWRVILKRTAVVNRLTGSLIPLLTPNISEAFQWKVNTEINPPR